MTCPNISIFFVCQGLLIEILLHMSIFSPCILYLIIVILKCFKRICNKQLWNKQWLQKKTDTVVEHVFDRILKKHRSQEGYIVLNYKAPPNYTNLLLYVFVLLIASAAVQFWDDFLYEESYGCIINSDICCYRQDLFQSENVDCSNTSNLKENIFNPVICYKFVFSLGKASGAALGIIATASLIIVIITWCLLKISHGSKRTRCRAIFTVFFQVTTTLVVSITTMVLWLQKLHRMGYIYMFTTKQIDKLAEMYPIGILISIYIVFFPWRTFVKNDDIQEYESIQA